MVKYTTRKVIDLQDWDRLVEQTYGRTYSFQQQDGCQERGTFDFSVPVEWIEDYENTSIPEVVNGQEMGVSFKAWLERDPKQPILNQQYNWELGMFWDRSFYPHITMVIKDLHEKGLLEEGDYSINIDW